MKCWLGIDCGSVSIKFALMNSRGDLIRSLYLRNQGIIETLQNGLRELYDERLEVAGVGCTGSGRQFVGILAGADVIKTEILAHTIGALHYHPDVQTIMDIGGEDCKIISVRNGVLVNFIMNNVCGAGTGAVIEAIAGRLGIAIEEVGDIALSSTKRLNFPGKCGIFCQSAVVTRLNSGAEKSDIMMGVIRALVNNFLSLAKGIKLSPPYIFQGATAQNRAVVRALEDQLKHKVIVPRECSTMGAIGIALLALDLDIYNTNFKGFNLRNYKTKIVCCSGCANRCEVTLIFERGELVGSIGSRCEKGSLKVKRDLSLVPT
jgi:predicted CoA-substrate-specific enzyme activase